MHSCLCVLHALFQLPFCSQLRMNLTKDQRFALLKHFFANKSYKNFAQMYQLKYSMFLHQLIKLCMTWFVIWFTANVYVKLYLIALDVEITSLSVSRYTLHLQQTLAVIAYEFSRPVLSYHMPENTVHEKTCKLSATTLTCFNTINIFQTYKITFVPFHGWTLGL